MGNHVTITISRKMLEEYARIDVERMKWVRDYMDELHLRCCRCGVTKYEHQHDYSSKDGHPFFSNNLEMVEWHYEQKAKETANV